METAPLRRVFWAAGFTLLLLEAGIRLTGLDMRLLRPLLYYQEAFPELHEPAADPALLYRLKPGARTESAGASFGINSLGFRDPPRAARKPPGVVRIVCLGASYMFGALVDDAQTLPRNLEALLNEKFQGRFEVWNAGVSAYNILQEAGYARAIERDYEPDLMLFHLNGAGRRAFLPGQPFAPFFRAEPGLYLENLAYVPWARSPWGLRLMAGCALYRAAVILINRRDPQPQPRPDLTDRLNRESWRSYLASSRPDLPKAILILGGGRWPDPAGTLAQITLYRGPSVPARLPPEYFLIHPPAPVYRLQAQVAAERLSAAFPRLLRLKRSGRGLVEPMPPSRLSLGPRQVEESLRAMRDAGREDCLRDFLSGAAQR
jgi:hypothetical protein